MTGFCFGLFLITSVIAVVYGLGEDCSVGTDCGQGECCLSHGGLKGKRALGSCQRKGEQGRKCYVENRFASQGVYYSCPCYEGYTCRGTHLVEVPYGETGVCERQVKSCASGSDCAADECCVSLIRPLGKRMLANVCKKLGDVKDNCLVSIGSGKKDAVSFHCPCKSDLTCKPNGRFDIPLGSMGNCV